MANKKLMAIVTMMVLLGADASAQSDPTLEDLLTIDKLIQDGDWRALYTYVEANPRLTAGSSPLAQELQSFKDDIERGQLNTFDAGPSAPQQDASRTDNDSAAIY